VDGLKVIDAEGPAYTDIHRDSGPSLNADDGLAMTSWYAPEYAHSSFRTADQC